MEASKFNVFFMIIMFLAIFWSKINEISSVWDKKKHQFVDLGVIYRTVPSESPNLKKIMSKNVKNKLDAYT